MTTDYSVNVRAVALDVLTEVLENGAFSHLVLRQALSKYGYLEKSQRAFLTRLVQGCIARKLEMDYRIDSVSSVKTEKMKPVIRTLLRMTAYQIWYMDHVPDHAACSEAVKLAGKRGFAQLKGFVNGVSRGLCREKQRERAMAEASSPTESMPALPFTVRYSIPGWLDAYLADYYDEAARETIYRSCLKEEEHGGGVTVRCNVSKASEQEILKSLASQGVEAEKIPGIQHTFHLKGYDTPDRLEAFIRGEIQVQDGSSILAGQAAAPKPGDFCIDVCAAPGGKSLHMADQLRGTGMVESCDLTPQKVMLIEENIRRCGFSNMRAMVADASVYRPDIAQKADVVMADLPCSGLGVMGRKPDIKYQMSREKMESLVALQRKILSVVQAYVKPGGVLIYSTCTINPAENLENVRWLTSRYPFCLESLEPYLSRRDFGKTVEDGYIQLLPENGRTGFFIARLTRLPKREQDKG